MYLWALVHIFTFYCLNMYSINYIFKIFTYEALNGFFYSSSKCYLYFESRLCRIKKNVPLNMLIDHIIERILYSGKSSTCDSFKPSDRYLYLVDETYYPNKRFAFEDNNCCLYMAFEDKKKVILKEGGRRIRSSFDTGLLIWKKNEAYGTFLKFCYRYDPKYLNFLLEENVKSQRDLLVTYQSIIGCYDYHLLKSTLVGSNSNLLDRYNFVYSFIDQQIQKNGLENYKKLSAAEELFYNKLVDHNILKSLLYLETKHKIFITQYIEQNPGSEKLFRSSVDNYRFLTSSSKFKNTSFVIAYKNYIDFLFNGVDKKHAFIIKYINEDTIAVFAITHYGRNGSSDMATKFIDTYMDPIFFGLDKNGKEEFITRPVIYPLGSVDILDLPTEYTLYNYTDLDVSPEAMNRIFLKNQFLCFN